MGAVEGGVTATVPRLGSRKTAGLIPVIFPAVIYGGISLLTFPIETRDTSITPFAPNRLIYLCFAGAVVLSTTLVVLGIGLLREREGT